LLNGNIEGRIEEILNGVFLSLDKNVIQKPKKLIAKEYLTKKQEKSSQRLSQIKVEVSGKVFYKDNQQKLGYFLVNDYQREREFDSLNIGSTLNISLVQGYKHQFLNRILPP
jgi:hypothetical protein